MSGRGRRNGRGRSSLSGLCFPLCDGFVSVPPFSLIGGLSWGGCVNDVVLVFVEVSGFPEEVPATLVIDSVLVLVHALTVYTHLSVSASRSFCSWPVRHAISGTGVKAKKL